MTFCLQKWTEEQSLGFSDRQIFIHSLVLSDFAQLFLSSTKVCKTTDVAWFKHGGLTPSWQSAVLSSTRNDLKRKYSKSHSREPRTIAASALPARLVGSHNEAPRHKQRCMLGCTVYCAGKTIIVRSSGCTDRGPPVPRVKGTPAQLVMCGTFRQMPGNFAALLGLRFVCTFV